MKSAVPDFSEFAPGTVTEYTTLVCLACIFEIFTKQIGLAPRSAYSEIKRYVPTVDELTSRKAVRPFFDWLDTLRISIDLSEPEWLLAATKALLERKEPKQKWDEIFEGLRSIRPSARLEEGWERDGSRLFLSPALYNESLLVQYLLSRSHEHGGRTLAGRLTLMELIRRMRRGGYLEAHQISDTDQFEIFEKLVDEVAGSGNVKLYFVVDRREFLDKVKSVYAAYA